MTIWMSREQNKELGEKGLGIGRQGQGYTKYFSKMYFPQRLMRKADPFQELLPGRVGGPFTKTKYSNTAKKGL